MATEHHAVHEGDDSQETGTLWRRADGRPLTAFELKVYARAGLSPEEALQWANAGFEPYYTGQLREAGADLVMALRVREMGLNSRHLRFAREHGEPLEAAGAADAVGFDDQLLREARSVGLKDATISIFGSSPAVREAILLKRAGVATRKILAWKDAGLDLAECRQELAGGVPEDAVETTIAWHRAFQQPEARRAWRATGLDPGAAKSAAARGYRPIDVLEGRLADGSAPKMKRRKVILSDLLREPRTADGAPLPPAVLSALNTSKTTAVLRAFGYKVAWETAQSRFAEEHADDIVIFFRSEHGRGVAAVESTSEGCQLSVMPRRYFSALVTEHASVEDALRAFASRADNDKFYVAAVSSRAIDAPDLLRAAQPLASHLSERTTINNLVVKIVATNDGCWIIPGNPAKWPRHYLSDNGEVEAVGTLFLIRTLQADPVGWFGDPAAGFAAAHSRVPLLLVGRTDRDGETRTTALFGGDAGLVIVDARGRRRQLGSDDVLTAVSRVGALRDIRPNEATAFFTSSGGPSTDELIRLLRLRHPELLATEELVEFPGDYEADIWPDVPVDEGVSRRAVLINGERWVAIPPGPGVRPRLLPREKSDEWRIGPAFRQGEFKVVDVVT